LPDAKTRRGILGRRTSTLDVHSMECSISVDLIARRTRQSVASQT
jgi:hypothetical protein